MGLLVAWLVVIFALAVAILAAKSGLIGPAGSRSPRGHLLLGIAFGLTAGATVAIAMPGAADIRVGVVAILGAGICGPLFGTVGRVL